jgi:hypothetical protein
MKIKRSFRLLTFAVLLCSLLLNACTSTGTSTPVQNTTTPTIPPPPTTTARFIALKPSLTPRPTRTLRPSLTVEPGSIDTPTTDPAAVIQPSFTPEGAQIPDENGNVDTEPTLTPETDGEPVDTAEPTDEFTGADTNTPTPLPAAPGLTRERPFPAGQAASVPNWTVQVVGMKRGSEARTALEDANSTTMNPPPNFEYLLVKIKVKCAYTDKEQHSISVSDFKLTGDRLIAYTPMDVSVPDPALDNLLQTGEEAQGWAAFVVGKNEHDLILAVDEIANDSPDRIRYIAVESDASISMPANLANIKATDMGTMPSQPAPRSVTVVTNEWEVSVLDVIKGKNALDMVMANAYNLPPDAGMTYIVVKVYVRYRGTVDRPVGIDNYYFTTTDSSGTLYDFTTVFSPAPAMDVTLFPGADYAGYVVVQSAVSSNNLTLVFQAVDDTSGESLRYIALDY